MHRKMHLLSAAAAALIGMVSAGAAASVRAVQSIPIDLWTTPANTTATKRSRHGSVAADKRRAAKAKNVARNRAAHRRAGR